MQDISPKTIRRFSKEYAANVDVVQLLIESFGENIAEDILRMHPSEIRQTARVNFLKTSREEVIAILREDGIHATELEGIEEGIEIFLGGERIGHSIAYLAGLVTPQGFGSLLTVHTLDPLPGELILDMAAAPGNKTAFIAERMRNTGELVANDSSRARLTSLKSNLNRHGIRNTIVTNYDGAVFPTERKFDRILLDAPCTGEGLLVSTPSRRKSRDSTDPFILQRIQQRLVKRALRLLKKGGVIVYSTCSMNSVENEEVLEPFINRLEMKRVEVKLETPFYPSSLLDNVVRLLPNFHYCDGFFIAKGIKK